MIDRDLLMRRLKGHIDALAYRHTHTELIEPGGGKPSYRHITHHPALVEQLVMRPKDPEAPDTGRTVYESSPPAHLHAIDRHRAIQDETLSWLAKMNIEPRARLTQCLSALIGGATRLDAEALEDLVADARRWWAWARTITGWDAPPYQPWGPCPGCNKIGGIRVRAKPRTAVCVECWSYWDEPGVEQLAEFIRMWSDAQNVAKS